MQPLQLPRLQRQIRIKTQVINNSFLIILGIASSNIKLFIESKRRPYAVCSIHVMGFRWEVVHMGNVRSLNIVQFLFVRDISCFNKKQWKIKNE